MTEDVIGKPDLTLARATTHVEDVRYAETIDIGGHAIAADEPKARAGRSCFGDHFRELRSQFETLDQQFSERLYLPCGMLARWVNDIDACRR